VSIVKNIVEGIVLQAWGRVNKKKMMKKKAACQVRNEVKY